MDPDGDYESRHSIRSTASDACVNNPTSIDNDDITSPSKIFAPNDDSTKPPAKSMDGQVNDYVGASAPPMEGAPPPAAAAASTAAAASSNGSAYDDMMGGKMDVTTTDEAPISNSVAVPIGFDSDDMALPEAKALPIISSTANEGTKMPPATLEEVDVDNTESQINEEEPTPVPVPFSSNVDGSSTNPDATSARELDEQSGQDEKVPSPKKCTRKCKLCFVALVFFAILGTALGVLFGTSKGQMLLKGYPKCNGNPVWIADGSCNVRVNTAECGYDGGDCELYNSLPDCHVDYPSWIGNGGCNGRGSYNTAECGWDGGDCVLDGYPDCHVVYPKWIGNDFCDHGEYNTAECGWDGGDCLFDKRYNRACRGTIGSTWNSKTRAWCQHKCMDEGVDCKAYDYNSDLDNCRIFSSYSPTWHNKNRNCWVKRDSALAAEDIIEKLSECISGNPATGGINESCVGGVLSTLSQDTIDKLTPCAGLEVNEWKACIVGQFIK